MKERKPLSASAQARADRLAEKSRLKAAARWEKDAPARAAAAEKVARKKAAKDARVERHQTKRIICESKEAHTLRLSHGAFSDEVTAHYPPVPTSQGTDYLAAMVFMGLGLIAFLGSLPGGVAASPFVYLAVLVAAIVIAVAWDFTHPVEDTSETKA